ncbi:hypothetical protein [Pseudofrankia sp. BMG5.37]|uniref:hypothetical protein n=1 Tax=Pseudofrankia sp. BMG5.37 TaxID=3050035 RepID=UPI002894CB37|nr:hypothetical protein [Pseudofrankia sp. BMG5.37]MDT3443823.1 hypothetical protein [Pseudofrankia sp. BMG5.37]
MDVAAVAAWATLAGPVCALAAVCLRLHARARRDRKDRELMLMLVERLPQGGRLVFERGEDGARTVLTPYEQDV